MIDTITGIFVKHRYCLKKEQSLDLIPFRDAMANNETRFLSEFENQKIAISVWTTPKRTKNPPWGRVYDTLPYSDEISSVYDTLPYRDAIKICIIPAYHNTGIGDPNKIQPSTFSWFAAIGNIYIIVGKYVDAEKTTKRKDAANKKSGKPSKAGEPILTYKNSHYDLDDLEKQITKIITENPTVVAWNQSQIKKIPIWLDESADIVKNLCDKYGVECNTKRLEALKKEAEIWKNDHNQYLKDFDDASMDSQQREFLSDQKFENVPGKKGKIDIAVPPFPILHLTADSMKVDPEKKIIKLLEGKNTNEKFNKPGMVYEQHVKLMVFFNSDFSIDNKNYNQELVSYLTTDVKSATREEINEKYKEIIQDNNANEIEFQVDGETIK